MSLAKAGSVRVKLAAINIRLKEFDSAECRHTLLCYVQHRGTFH